MKKYLEILKANQLFSGIEEFDLEKILNCLDAKYVSYKKNDTIIFYGDVLSSIGIVLSGSIEIIKEDISGNVNILTKLGINEVFAEAFACAGIVESPVMVQAAEDCDVIFIVCKRIISNCSSMCAFHTKLIENMIGLIARKNVMLNQKIDIMSKRTTREKLLLFFDIQRRISNRKKFRIPYNRESLASYLCIDRSAMSRELSKMRDEGLLKFEKNEFELL